MNKRIIIGARGSALSLAYVEKVKKLLKKTQVFSEEDIIFKKIKTSINGRVSTMFIFF